MDPNVLRQLQNHRHCGIYASVKFCPYKPAFEWAFELLFSTLEKYWRIKVIKVLGLGNLYGQAFADACKFLCIKLVFYESALLPAFVIAHTYYL